MKKNIKRTTQTTNDANYLRRISAAFAAALFGDYSVILLLSAVFIVLTASVPSSAQAVKAWGDNGDGQLGNGMTVANGNVPPVNTSNLPSDVTAVSAGLRHSLALKSDGTVVAWGNNARGQLGNFSTTNSNVPVQVLMAGPSGSQVPLTNVTAISAGNQHCLALLADGTIMSWGRNSAGQLGTTPSSSRNFAAPVQGIGGGNSLRAVAISAGGQHSLALLNDGTVVAWGSNSGGQLGNGTFDDSSSPVTVISETSTAGGVPLRNIVAISAGSSFPYSFSVALKSDGTVVAWGANDSGQLGNNQGGDYSTATRTNTPGKVVADANSTALNNIVAVSAGTDFASALKNDGSVVTWGDNFYGQLGNGTNAQNSPSLRAQPVVGVNGTGTLSNIVAISSSGTHTTAVRSNGTVVNWGRGASGNNTGAQFTVAPVVVLEASGEPLSNIAAVDAGITGLTAHSLALVAPTATTPTGTNVSVPLGSGTISFGSVDTAGSTSVAILITVPAYNFPNANYSLLASQQVVDVSTSATTSGTIITCFRVENVTDAITFSKLAVLHGESPNWVDRTVSRDYASRLICGATSSLSPFAIAVVNAPTAASVTVSGRAMTTRGRGIANVRITMTDENGNIRTATTSSFGYYQFTDVAAGETYIFSASGKRYTFIQSSRVLNINEDTDGVDFVGDLSLRGLSNFGN